MGLTYTLKYFHYRRTEFELMSVQSVERALKILTLFSHRQPVLGISELSRLMNLPKGTVHGLTRTLVQHGFLKQDEQTRKYRLGLKIH